MPHPLGGKFPECHENSCLNSLFTTELRSVKIPAMHQFPLKRRSLQQALFVPHFTHAETKNLRLSGGEETKKAKTSRSSFSEIDEHTELPFNGFLMD